MNKKYTPLIMLVILVIIGILAFILLSDNSLSNKISPISIVTLNDENSSTIITKNNIDKTAKINMEVYMSQSELTEESFFDMDLTELTTRMMCGIISLAFFNETALEEFNDLVNGWADMNESISDGEGKEIGELEGNPIEGYNVTEVKFYIKDKDTLSNLGECLIKGYGSNEFIKMKIGGKEVAFEQEE